MECGAANFEARAGTTVFLLYFKYPPDRRQLGKAVYPLEEILLLRMLAVLAGAESFVDIARGRREEARPLAPVPSLSKGAFWAARRHAIPLASPPSTRGRSSAALPLGSRRRPRHRRRSSPSSFDFAQDEERDAAPLLSEEGVERADLHGFGLLSLSKGPRASALWSDRSRWRKNPTRSPPFPRCST